jgi:hypothetical protein
VRRLAPALVGVIILMAAACVESERAQSVTQLGSQPDGPHVRCDAGASSSEAPASSSEAPASSSEAPASSSEAPDTPPATRHVRGRAVDDFGCPIAGIFVEFTIFSTGAWPRGVTGADGSYDAECPDAGSSAYLVLSGQPFDLVSTALPNEPAQNFAPSLVGTTDPTSTALPVLCELDDPPVVVTPLHPGGTITGAVYKEYEGEQTLAQPYVRVVIGTVPLPCSCEWASFATYPTDGHFTFTGLPAGEYRIETTTGGKATVRVEVGQTVTQDIHSICGGAPTLTETSFC